MATNSTFGINRVTMISIAASAIIIGLSIGITSMFSPQLGSIQKQRNSIIKSGTMKTRCAQFQDILNQSEQAEGENNVMAYNLQRLYGQCFMNNRPVELLKITGCTKTNGFEWKLKDDASIFDFCPDLKTSS